MKMFEWLYILGFFMIILSIIFYMFSTTVILNPEEGNVSNLLGKTTDIDTSFAASDVIQDAQSMARHREGIILWVGIPLGIATFLTGLIIKRKKEGPDRFIDDELDEDEAVDFPFL